MQSQRTGSIDGHDSAYWILVLPGDGIGPEVTAAARLVMDEVDARRGIPTAYTERAVGASVYAATGETIPEETMRAVGEADAVLFGAAGLPDVRTSDGTETTPQIDIRERYGLFASLRPAVSFPGVPTRVQADGVDILVIRETTEGLFAGRHDVVDDCDDEASDRLTITRATSERLFTLAFEQARRRRSVQRAPGRVTLLDKSNVLRSNAFLRRVFDDVASRFPDVESERLYIDAGSMMLVTQPERFDVLVTENVFGDIVSEVAAGVVGGLGVAPSGDVSETRGVFQPCHGSAPQIAGTNTANPVAAVLSAAMLYDWLASRHDDVRCRRAAADVRSAVADTLRDGPRTRDLGGSATTTEVADAVVRRLR